MSPAGAALSPARPFTGLRPFEYGDSAYFFGREDQSFALYRLVDVSTFVAVIGSSGSGKSSLVLAGLLPLLEKERAEGGRKWRWEIMTPGEDPLGGLTDAVAKLAVDDDPQLRAERRQRIDYRIRRSSFGMADALREIDGFEGSTLLLIVDQFEELFRSSGSSVPASTIEWERARDAAAKFVQILLEAERDPQLDVHVLITMRSDFIGDCARFHGLPEAVSASQFLAPALTRDQLEEAICKPIEKAGAIIDPELVQRLLNDSVDDADQLPVLQHALLQLWRHAGARMSPQGAPTPTRHIRPDDYVEIGKLSGALSQHADQILATLPEAVVESVFRALSDVDSERRIVRRPLPFWRLAQETGIDTDQLRQALAPFRADDCAFLMPSLTRVPELRLDSQIRVGHEALLRRWTRVSGDPNLPVRERKGWWRAEDADGQRHRWFLFMLDTGTKVLSFDNVKDHANWWRERLRTTAWAERYGGRRDDVEALILSSEAAAAQHEKKLAEEEAEEKARKLKRTRDRKIRQRATVAGAFVAMIALWYIWYQLNVQFQSAALANQKVQSVTASTRDFLIKVEDSFVRGDIRAKGAKALLEIANGTVNQLFQTDANDDAKLTRINYLFAVSDLSWDLQDFKNARDRAADARRIAAQLEASDKLNPIWPRFVSEAALRVGNAAANLAEADVTDAEVMKDYESARDEALEAAKRRSDDPKAQLSIAAARARLGDWKLKVKDFAGATAEFDESLRVMTKLVERADTKPEWRGELASAMQRVGRDRLRHQKLDEAADLLSRAFEIRTELAAASDSMVFVSNLTSSQSDLARLDEAKGHWRDALARFRTVLARAVAMTARDPSNALWSKYLAQDYALSIRSLEKSLNAADISEAERRDNSQSIVEFCQKEATLRRMLAELDPSEGKPLRDVAAVDEKLGDAFARLGRWEDQIGAYRLAIEDWDKVAKLPSGCADCGRIEASLGAKIGDVLMRRP